MIDIDETVRDVVRQLLQSDGHEVTECEDGVCGLEAHSQEPSELVALNIQMPGMNGF